MDLILVKSFCLVFIWFLSVKPKEQIRPSKPKLALMLLETMDEFYAQLLF